MQKVYKIKLARKNVKSNNKKCFFIIVAFNDAKVSGGLIDKIGYFKSDENGNVYGINFYKLGIWLNQGAVLNSRASYMVSFFRLNY